MPNALTQLHRENRQHGYVCISMDNESSYAVPYFEWDRIVSELESKKTFIRAVSVDGIDLIIRSVAICDMALIPADYYAMVTASQDEESVLGNDLNG